MTVSGALKYIELKTGHSDDGPAWIARVVTSRSGSTIYFNGKALRKAKGGLGSGNYVDIETGEAYWVSGVKKDGTDRHWAGSGAVAIEEGAVDEYLRLTGARALDRSKFRIIDDLDRPDSSKLHELENEKLPPRQ